MCYLTSTFGQSILKETGLLNGYLHCANYCESPRLVTFHGDYFPYWLRKHFGTERVNEVSCYGKGELRLRQRDKE